VWLATASDEDLGEILESFYFNFRAGKSPPHAPALLVEN
jgi:hypothetical protein